MRKISTLIQLLLLAFLPLTLQATHIVGGEMTYRCLGNEDYEIKLTIFRDCANGIPPFDDPASIGIFDNNTNLYLDQILVSLDPMINDTLDPTLDNDCLAVPPNVCVHTTTYTTVINLPFRPGGYHLAYQRCCRNNTIVNLIAPEDVGATYGVVLTEEAMNICNESPEFVDWPPLYLCGNVPFIIDQSATDTDGDSLVYKLCNPLTGANDVFPMPQPPNPPPYDPVPWLPPFDASSMINMPPDPPMVIDSETGMLTGTPTILGQFVIGICIEEYRNGVLIGEYRRDYQVNIGDCEAIVASAADPGLECGSRTVSFQNESINANDFEWHFNDPGNPGAMSMEANPTFTFSDWGVYEVWLIAEPGAICADTAFIEVNVQPASAMADFEVELIECLNDVKINLTDLSTDSFSTINSWEWTLSYGSDVFTSNEQNPMFVVTPPGGAIISLTVTNEVGCSDTFEDIIPIKPPLLNLDLGPDINDCDIGQIELDAGPGFVSYLWSDLSTGQTLIVDTPGTYEVIVEDACGNVTADEVTIELSQIEVDAGPDMEVCSPGETVTLSGTVTGTFNNVQWELSTGMSDPNSLTTDVFVSSTTTFTLTVFSNAVANLITNGDFEMGDTGFSSDYIPGTGGPFGLLSNEGEYAVAGSPAATHNNFADCPDHTSGAGNMMVINGAEIPNENVWCQTVAVDAGTDYEFSAWMTSAISESPAILQFSINGNLLGSPFGLSGVTCDWENFFETWNSGTETTAEICIVNQNTAGSGNDFAIDDISFGPVCVASDDVTVTVQPGEETSETREICSGDSTVVFGMVVTDAGVFSETFTAQNGCDSIHTITVNVIQGVETEEEVGICDGETIDVFGNPVSMAGEYSETFTAQNGCDSIHTITVIIYPNYHIIEDAQICDGDTVFIFGNPISMSGEFSDTLATVNGCDSIRTVNLAVLPNAFTSETISICFGETTEIFGNQEGASGVYEMTVPASNGCDSTHTITLEVYDEITIMTTTTDATCFGVADGTATATAAGGNGGFTYAWSNGDVGEIATGLPAGSHSVTVTDATGCIAEATVTIDQPAEVEVVATGVDVSCTELGSVSASASGGSGNFTFEWSTGDMTADVSDLEAGVYSVTATDDNNCTAETSVEITGALAPEIEINVDNQLSGDDPDGGELSVSISGGTSPFEIEWSNGSTSDSLFNLSSGQYIVIVTDANGCEVQDTAYLFVEACTGGKIWKDSNRNGCQDGGEVGIADVEMSLLGVDIWGNSITATATSANNGEYIFEGLPPGEYLIFMDVPDGYTLTTPDACIDDFVDSDFDMNGVATELVTLTEGHCCLIIDGGLYDDCLNVFDAGEICCDQTLCGPGNIAAPITSVSVPGGANQIEFRWIYSQANGSNGGGTAWQQVTDPFGNPVTPTTLNPGPIYTTTYFARCVRAVGCTEWLVSDIVTITVDDDAVADINEPGAICVGDNITFTSAGNSPGASYLWNFGPTATPQFSNDPSPTVTYSQSGYPTVWLTVTNNGCTSTDQMLIAVSNDPTYCGTAIGNSGTQVNHPNISELTAFQVYPNPITDKLTVVWGSGIESDVQIEILSMEGKILQTQKIDAQNYIYNTNLNHLTAGIYMLRVRHSDGAQEVFKLVKK